MDGVVVEEERKCMGLKVGAGPTFAKREVVGASGEKLKLLVGTFHGGMRVRVEGCIWGELYMKMRHGLNFSCIWERRKYNY